MIKVVVIEDSAVQRGYLVKALEAEGDIRVVATAPDAATALQVVREHRPDVVTVDLQLPGGGGRYAIEQIMGYVPTPILVLSARVTGAQSEEAVDALVAGALDVLPKPIRWTVAAETEVRRRIRVLTGATVLRHPRGRRPAEPVASPRARSLPIVAVAASTGGPPALAKVLSGLGGLRAAVLVVQHLHPDFIDGFVAWMARVSPLPVQAACDAVPVQAGAVYIAPGGTHLKLSDRRLSLAEEPRSLHRPSADELFASVARSAGRRAVGVLLTGMGDDGAKGLLAMRSAGAHTIAQDERTSAVYGMPRAATAVDAVVQVLPLDDIAEAVKRAVRRVTG